jgi:hypothetical protein
VPAAAHALRWLIIPQNFEWRQMSIAYKSKAPKRLICSESSAVSDEPPALHYILAFLMAAVSAYAEVMCVK